jgi:hypothetical protein
MRGQLEFFEQMRGTQMGIGIMVEMETEMARDNWAGLKLGVEIPGPHGA